MAWNKNDLSPARPDTTRRANSSIGVGIDPWSGTVLDAERGVILRTAVGRSNNVQLVLESLARGDHMNPEDLQRRRRLAKLKRKGCGCDSSRLCKHYYQNTRPVVSGTERHTEGDTDPGAAVTSPVQTFLNVDSFPGEMQVVTPSSTRLYRLLLRRSQRL